jgi:serine/threonine protein kinase
MSNPAVRTLPTPIALADFDVGVTLGTGSFGRVRFATHRGTGSFWAIKMLKKAEVIRLQQVEHMISEKNILSNLDHPFIVRLSGTFQGKKLFSSRFSEVITLCCGRSKISLHGT